MITTQCTFISTEFQREYKIFILRTTFTWYTLNHTAIILVKTLGQYNISQTLKNQYYMSKI